MRKIQWEYLIALLLFLTITLLPVFMAKSTAGMSLMSAQKTLELFIQKSNPKLEAHIKEVVAGQIIIAAMEASIPWEIIAAIAYVESRYNPYAIGPCDDRGVMQIHSKECAGHVINRDYLFNVEYNILVGVCILKEKLEQTEGDMLNAIGRYNGSGPAAIKYAEKVCKIVMEIMELETASSKERSPDA